MTPEKLYVLLAPEKYVFVDAQFDSDARTWTYLADAGKYLPGDHAVAPCRDGMAIITIAAVRPIDAEGLEVPYALCFLHCHARPDHGHGLAIIAVEESTRQRTLERLAKKELRRAGLRSKE